MEISRQTPIEKQHLILAARIKEILQSRERQRKTRYLVRAAWLLAESSIKADSGDEKNRARVGRIRKKLKDTLFLDLSDNIRSSLETAPNNTRAELARMLSK